MKKIPMILTIAILLPAFAFARKKKEQDNGPTLKETSDWLATTLTAYGSFANGSQRWEYNNVVLDNDCKFSLILSITEPQDPTHLWIEEDSLPLGAVDSIDERSDDRSFEIISLHTGQLAAVHRASQFNQKPNFTVDTNQLDLTIGGRPNIRPNE